MTLNTTLNCVVWYLATGFTLQLGYELHWTIKEGPNRYSIEDMRKAEDRKIMHLDWPLCFRTSIFWSLWLSIDLICTVFVQIGKGASWFRDFMSHVR